MTVLSGRIDHVAYHNEADRFTVARLLLPDRRTSVTVVGHIASPVAGDNVRVTGRWQTHPKYGQQFRVDTLEVMMPTSLEGIRNYLTSGWIKGVGARTAEGILERFGVDTFSIIENEPQRLTEVEGVGAARAMAIHAQWQAMAACREITFFLQENGISGAYGQKLFDAYGPEAPAIIREDPYRLASDIPELGFAAADRIAKNLGADPEAPERACSCIRHALAEAESEGHLFAHEDSLMEHITGRYDLAEAALEASLGEMIRTGELVAEAGTEAAGERRIYPKELYAAETAIAHRLAALLAVPLPSAGEATTDLIAQSQERLAISLSREQKDALATVLENRVAIITGGPGTGKTTLIQAVHAVFRRLGVRVCLAAPTGRAARRLSEVTGKPAHTIHKLLGYNFDDGFFGRNADNPIDADLLVVDESSMVDARLMHHLLAALSFSCRLVMVGDAFQLPPVGAGNVLADLIASNTIAIARLTDIYRQSDESLITWNAHLVREGKAPELTPFEEAGDCDSEFYFCEVLDPESASEKICRLCSDWLPRRYRLDPLADIQVLSPVHKGTVGTIDLNQRLQSALNPEGRRIPGTGRGFREGDKVLNLKNNYAKEVYNGDVGRICGIDLSLSTLQVDFDGRIVDYAAAELEELTLGYAISVHKSQGSEYPVVICPVVTRHYVMLQRQLLYTAITRGRSLVILVGSRRAIGLALSNNRPQTRLSALAERLGGLAGLCP